MRLLPLLLLISCKGFDPVGSYVGTVKETAKAEIDLGPGTKPGTVNVQWWNTDRPRGNVEVTVERIGDRKIRVNLPGCGVLFEQTQEPNEHQAMVVATPMQVCEVDVDHYKGPITVGGLLQFDKKKRTVDVTVHGSAPQGPTRVNWGMHFAGDPKPK
jgi:hypothetical protein